MDERAKASQTRLDVLHVYLLEAADARSPTHQRN